MPRWRAFRVYAFLKFYSVHWSPYGSQHNAIRRWTKVRLTLKTSSSFSSFRASVLIALYSTGVKEVPPPRGKSTSSGRKIEVAGAVCSSAFSEIFRRFRWVICDVLTSALLLLPVIREICCLGDQRQEVTHWQVL